MGGTHGFCIGYFGMLIAAMAAPWFGLGPWGFLYFCCAPWVYDRVQAYGKRHGL